jgi:hypothetical protein
VFDIGLRGIAFPHGSQWSGKDDHQLMLQPLMADLPSRVMGKSASSFRLM